jgi:hypothetical protein
MRWEKDPVDRLKNLDQGSFCQYIRNLADKCLEMIGGIVKVHCILVHILLIEDETGLITNFLVKVVNQASFFKVTGQDNQIGIR